MRMMSIASGSSGNCIYIGSDDTHILIDAGISRRKIEEGLKLAGLSLADIDAIFVTHEHSDHIKGLGVIARRDEIPIYTTSGTMKGIRQTTSLGEIPADLFRQVSADENVKVGDLTVHSFAISHDAAEPVAYTVSCGGKKAGVCTDLGIYTDYTVQNLKGADALLVEANHDINLLEVGPYPYYLKQRILGRKGHLCNEAGGRLISSVLSDRVRTVFLGHLSKENNYDRLAYEAVRQEIDMADNPYRAKDFDIRVAGRDVPSGIVEL
jgi:phosphoribosyl 1,2-cyclic phosphodiesterase